MWNIPTYGMYRLHMDDQPEILLPTWGSHPSEPRPWSWKVGGNPKGFKRFPFCHGGTPSCLPSCNPYNVINGKTMESHGSRVSYIIYETASWTGSIYHVVNPLQTSPESSPCSNGLDSDNPQVGVVCCGVSHIIPDSDFAFPSLWGLLHICAY